MRLYCLPVLLIFLTACSTPVTRVGGEQIAIPQTGGVAGARGCAYMPKTSAPGGSAVSQGKLANIARDTGPVVACLVQNTHIGYMHWQDLSDPDLFRQVTDALSAMSAAGNLQGLIVDARGSSGGDIGSVKQLLGLFTGGEFGTYIADGQEASIAIYSPVDLYGSQTVPLVVLQDADSGPMAALFSSVLQVSQRAVVVGQAGKNPLYILKPLDPGSLSSLKLSTADFAAGSAPGGYADQRGILPDYEVPAESAAADPALAKAVELLMR